MTVVVSMFVRSLGTKQFNNRSRTFCQLDVVDIFYMALVALKRVLCCCIADDGHDVNQVDESTHLIPSQEEPNVS